MTQQEIKTALSIEISFVSNSCGTDSYSVALLWGDEIISEDEVEINE
jgi:hypothetical protein